MIFLNNMKAQHRIDQPLSYSMFYVLHSSPGGQWLSGKVLDSRPKGGGFEHHLRHCVVVLEQDTSILA